MGNSHFHSQSLYDNSINICQLNTDHGTDLYQLDTELYVIRIIVSPSGIIARVANIVMHLMFSTVSGILVIFQCASIITILIVSTLHSSFYYHLINTPAEVHAIIFNYLNVVCI